jgi:hypothetical protein
MEGDEAYATQDNVLELDQGGFFSEGHFDE